MASSEKFMLAITLKTEIYCPESFFFERQYLDKPQLQLVAFLIFSLKSSALDLVRN